MKIEEEIKVQLLKDEYIALQGVVDNFDSKALRVKSWSVTFSLVILTISVSQWSWGIALISTLAASCFWLLEGCWKTFQHAHYKRLQDIEYFFSGKKPDITPLQISSSFIHRVKGYSWRRIIAVSWQAHVALPHAAIVIISIFIVITQVKIAEGVFQ